MRRPVTPFLLLSMPLLLAGPCPASAEEAGGGESPGTGGAPPEAGPEGPAAAAGGGGPAPAAGTTPESLVGAATARYPAAVTFPLKPRGHGYLVGPFGLMDPVAPELSGPGDFRAEVRTGSPLPATERERLLAATAARPASPDATLARYPWRDAKDADEAAAALEAAVARGDVGGAAAAVRRLLGMTESEADGWAAAAVAARREAQALLRRAEARGARHLPADRVVADPGGSAATLLAEARRWAATRKDVSPGGGAQVVPAFRRDGDEAAWERKKVLWEARKREARGKLLAAGTAMEGVLRRARSEALKSEERNREAHLRTLREAAFGSPSPGCEAARQCPCPEEHVPGVHEDLCHPSGEVPPCTGALLPFLGWPGEETQVPPPPPLPPPPPTAPGAAGTSAAPATAGTAGTGTGEPGRPEGSGGNP